MKRWTLVLFMGLPLLAQDDPGVRVYDVNLLTDERAGIDSDDLVEIVQQAVEPDSWMKAGRSIMFDKGTLVVRHTDAAHRRIADLLEYLTRTLVRQVTLDLSVARIGRGEIEKPDPSGQTLFMLKKTAYPLNSIRLKSAREVAFIGDIRVVGGQYEAVKSILEEGLAIEVTPLPAGDSVFMQISVRLTRMGRLESFESVRSLELPETVTRGLNLTLSAPVGRRVLAGWMSFADGDDVTAVFVRPTMTPGPSVRQVALEGGRALRVFDVGDLVYAFKDITVPHPAGEWPAEGRGGMAFQVSSDERIYEYASGDDLAALIKSNIGEWDKAGTLLRYTRGALIAVSLPEVLDKIEGFLRDYRQIRRRVPLQVDLKVISFDDAFHAKHVRPLKGLQAGGVMLQAAEAEALLKAAATEAVLSEVWLNTLSDHAAGAYKITSTHVVSEYLAAGGDKYDPKVSVVDEGVTVVIPRVNLDGERAKVSVVTRLAELVRPIQVLESAGGKLHKVVRDTQGTDDNLVVGRGKYAVLAVSSKSGGGRHTMLLMRVQD